MDEYSSYEDPSVPPEALDIVPTTTTTSTSTTTTTSATTSTSTTKRWPRKTAPPPVFEKKTTTTRAPPATVPMATVYGPLSLLIRKFAVPEFPTTTSFDPDDIITATASGGRSLQTKFNLTETEPAPTSSSSVFTITKKEKNLVDEVPYRIVGLDGEATRGQQNYFVPRMPPFP